MKHILTLYKDIIIQIGIFKFIKCFTVSLGIYLIYMRVFKNFKDAKKQKDNQKKEVKSIVEQQVCLCFLQ